MSHFAVAVITAEAPTDEVLTKALQPFHEFECTGIKDQYVVPIDETDEQRHAYENDTLEGVFKDGKYLGSKYLDKFESFWVRSSPLGRSSDDVFKLPEGYELKEVNAKDVYSFEEYLSDYCGYSLSGKYNELTSDGRFLRYTNPNKTWDWWVVGGRWSNSLLTKSGEQVDSCVIGELDFEGQIQKLKASANAQYDLFETLIGQVPKTWRTWGEIYNDDSIKSIAEKRNVYTSQKAITTIHSNDTTHIFRPFGLSIDDFKQSREDYVNKNSGKPFQCYNMLITSESDQEHLGWYGGEMGWWGMGTQEEDWETTYQNLLRSQPKDHYITVIDCHI